MSKFEYGNPDRDKLKEEIKKSSMEHNGKKYIIVFISRIKCSKKSPENFKLKHTVKIKPKKVALFYMEDTRMFFYSAYSKNGNILTRVESIAKEGKPLPKVFFTEKECISSYLEELLEANDFIDKKISDLEKLRSDLIKI